MYTIELKLSYLDSEEFWISLSCFCMGWGCESLPLFVSPKKSGGSPMKTIDNIAINETIIVNNTIKITKVPNGLIYTITSIYNNNTNSKDTIIKNIHLIPNYTNLFVNLRGVLT